MNARIVDEQSYEGLVAAADILRAGGVVAAQTDTNYAIMCSPFSESAARRLYAMKDRPASKPLSLLLGAHDQWRRWARPRHPELVERLADEFWPGPFNMVLPRRPIVEDWVTAGTDTVSVLHNRSYVINTISALAGFPMAVTSANISGTMDAGLVTFDIAVEHLGSAVDCVVRSLTPSAFNLSSTIVDLTTDEIVLIRQGDLALSEILQAAAP